MFASLLGDIFQPLALLWLVCLVATFGAFRRRQWRSAFSLLFVSALFFLVGNTPCAPLLVQRLETPYFLDRWDDVPEADAILVLGAAITSSSKDLTGFNLKRETDRVITAFELARRGKSKALVLGGGRGRPSKNTKSEGEHMQSWFTDWKVANVSTYLLPGNRNTHDEALGMKELATEKNWNTVLLVTSATHMHRSKSLLESLDLKVIPVACDFEGTSWLEQTGGWSVVPMETNFYLMRVYLHEIVGWPYYRLRGWIKDPRPFIW